MNTKFLYPVAKVLLLLCVTFTIANAQSPQNDEPVAMVINGMTELFMEVDDNLALYESDPEALQALVMRDLVPMLDTNHSARLILGRAGRGIPAEKIQEFSDAMVSMLVSRYSNGLLLLHSTEKVKVLPQRGALNEKLTRVRSRVVLPDGGEAPIDYAFHKTAEGWKAFDLIVEGISYVTTYRNQVVPEVQANGIDSVIARLKTGELQLAE
jgi:phospholipid transport system substrate-binding protein